MRCDWCLGRFDPDNKGGFKRWKANFRCALNSLPDVEEVKEESGMKTTDPYKVYRLLDPISHRSTSLPTSLHPCHTCSVIQFVDINLPHRCFFACWFVCSLSCLCTHALSTYALGLWSVDDGDNERSTPLPRIYTHCPFTKPECNN